MFLDAQSSQWAAAVGVGGGKVSQIKSLSLHCNMPGRKLPRWAEPILTYSRQRERFFHIKPCLSSSTGMKVAQQREGCWEHKSHRCTEAAESAERNAERNAVFKNIYHQNDCACPTHVPVTVHGKQLLYDLNWRFRTTGDQIYLHDVYNG